MSAIDPNATRTKLVETLNGSLANIELLKKRLHKAQAELGTAQAELRKAELEYAEHRSNLLRHLPEVAS